MVVVEAFPWRKRVQHEDSTQSAADSIGGIARNVFHDRDVVLAKKRRQSCQLEENSRLRRLRREHHVGIESDRAETTETDTTRTCRALPVLQRADAS